MPMQHPRPWHRNSVFGLTEGVPELCPSSAAETPSPLLLRPTTMPIPTCRCGPVLLDCWPMQLAFVNHYASPLF